MANNEMSVQCSSCGETYIEGTTLCVECMGTDLKPIDRGLRSRSEGWYRDPWRTHESRYWDGVQWTDQVSDRDGVVTADAPPPKPRSTGIGVIALFILILFIWLALLGLKLLGVIVAIAGIIFLAPSVGYRKRDVLFLFVPFYGIVFLVRVLWRFANLAGYHYWEDVRVPEG